MRILGASIGNCVHVAGIMHFLALAQREGHETAFLGPAIPVEHLMQSVSDSHPDMVCVSYRLSAANAAYLLRQLKDMASQLAYQPIWAFGGTKPVAGEAKKMRMFAFISDGFDDIDDSIRFLRNETKRGEEPTYADSLLKRKEESYPYPIIRHHYGESSLEKTIEGIGRIARAKVLDVISLGPDQNAQQFLFTPELMDEGLSGAGGVPFRTGEDLVRLKSASRQGNFPLMRSYSGTANVLRYAKLLRDTIDNAWVAVPLFWYNEMDGRGSRSLEVSIGDAQDLIKWHAERGVPCEINEPHHWGLRDAHDVITVAAAYLAAYNAKAYGTRSYIAQYMFNTSNGLSFPMDFARILAMIEMVESLHDKDFTSYRQSRTGLPLLHADPATAKGQLAASTFMQMAINPHIIHVVGFCEANHAAKAVDVIESCKIVRGVIRHTVGEAFSMQQDKPIKERRDKLIQEAGFLLDFIRRKFSNSADPLADPHVLAESVLRGYLDAMHIVKGNRFRGVLSTLYKNGMCLAYDSNSGRLLSEDERLCMVEELNG